MFNVADIVVIAIVIIAIFMGYKKGFIKTLFGVNICFNKPSILLE